MNIQYNTQKHNQFSLNMKYSLIKKINLIGTIATLEHCQYFYMRTDYYRLLSGLVERETNDACCGNDQR